MASINLLYFLFVKSIFIISREAKVAPKNKSWIVRESVGRKRNTIEFFITFADLNYPDKLVGCVLFYMAKILFLPSVYITRLV